MRNKRIRAFWMTLVFFALAGPPLGLLFVLVISFFIVAWGPAADWLASVSPHVQSPACVTSNIEHLDLRCFQRSEPRHFRFAPIDWHWLSLYVGVAYVVGFIPAVLAGGLICAGRLADWGFGYAILIAAVVGLVFAISLPTAGHLINRPEGAVLLFFTCFVPTIVCWLVTTRLWRKATSADANPTG